MTYNFDKIINRSNSKAVKLELLKMKFGNPNAIPMWVADMDFATPDFIRSALAKRLEHPILGYSLRGKEFDIAVKRWMQTMHQWNIQTEWVSFSPGIVSALAMAVQQYSLPGDKIIIQSPVYFPFKYDHNILHYSNSIFLYNKNVKSSNIVTVGFLSSSVDLLGSNQEQICCSNVFAPLLGRLH